MSNILSVVARNQKTNRGKRQWTIISLIGQWKQTTNSPFVCPKKTKTVHLVIIIISIHDPPQFGLKIMNKSGPLPFSELQP